ncbi:acyl carrier protein [Helicobacter muridarum]|uniref:Acyl carrier protein n=2 Tax=Helicobacter muridarum TaxID=216 RepID=A0A377PT22_9HELI|nr:acyl carrier protein [Helicobacter muridarum]TLD98288.1 acyl carrier protein [Helicobacter muridarum]STQ85562.1 Uncharacterised protein [Helicobacter muridarum]
MQDIIEVLRFKLIDLLDIESLQDTQSLLDSNEWDSLSKIAIIAFVEKRYQVSLSINELDKTNSLQDIAKLIVKHIDTNNTTKQDKLDTGGGGAILLESTYTIYILYTLLYSYLFLSFIGRRVYE